MAHQTDKDPRLKVAELALAILKSAIFSKSTVRPGLSKEATNNLLSKIDSQLMAIKYCYMEPNKLADSDMIIDIHESAKQLYMGYKEAMNSGMGDVPMANLLWAFNILAGLSRRLKNSGEKPTHGIDIIAVTIRNLNKQGELWITRSNAGQREFTIVTNMSGLSAGDTLVAALLPPATVGGVVSQAMFLGSEKYDIKAGTLMKPEDLNTKEADSVLYNELKSL